MYITWLEFYQYYHVINYFHGKTWAYTKESSEWVIDQDLRKTLGTKNLVNIMLILKFWHVLFVAGMWIFFVLRSNESERVRYPLIAGNILNFIMLYVLGWVYMYPWLKFFPRKYFSYVYKWFYQNNRTNGYRIIYTDFQIFMISFSDIKNLVTNYLNLPSYSNQPFFFIKPSSHTNGFVDFNKRYSHQQLLNDMLCFNKEVNKENNWIMQLLHNYTNIGQIIHNRIWGIILDLAASNNAYLRPTPTKHTHPIFPSASLINSVNDENYLLNSFLNMFHPSAFPYYFLIPCDPTNQIHMFLVETTHPLWAIKFMPVTAMEVYYFPYPFN